MLKLHHAVLLMCIGVAAHAATPGTRVTIDSGALQGEAQGEVISFKGIPFALPPTGELRWRPPQPAADWVGIRNASGYGADCMQIPFPSDAAPLGVKPAEDCLYLNVWRPAHASGKLPVFVWIYGGGFVNGGSSPAVYDGTPFARDGVIFVSFNYRLGRFGFFAHPALSAEQAGAPLANYAILDQIAALKWIRRNIGAFGGDPGKVTICGESAGGVSVHVLMTFAIGARALPTGDCAIRWRPKRSVAGARAYGWSNFRRGTRRRLREAGWHRGNGPRSVAKAARPAAGSLVGQPQPGDHEKPCRRDLGRWAGVGWQAPAGVARETLRSRQGGAYSPHGGRQ